MPRCLSGTTPVSSGSHASRSTLDPGATVGLIAYGSTHWSLVEARDRLRAAGIPTGYLRLRTLPIGTGYAVWVGVGASLTVVYGMVSGAESVSLIKVLLLMGLIGCIIGLKLAH